MILRKSDLSGKDMHRSAKEKKQPGTGSHSKDDEMSEERRNVSQAARKNTRT